MSHQATPADPVVSVVTPFYNTERYLADAIESVLAQTYGNFEYLLVDNRSTDGSLAIAQRYAAHDPRIRVSINRDFVDQDTNFSGALRQISPGSRYCKIVLADDCLLPRCLEAMVAVAEAHPSVGMVSSYYLKGTQLMGSGMPYPTARLTGRDVCRLQILDGVFFFGSPTTIMFRSDVVRSVVPFYDAAAPHADTEACYRTMRSSDFGFVHQVLSFLRVEDGSRMGAIRDYFADHLDRYIIIEKFGRDFLTADEHRAVERRSRTAYFRRLSEALLFRRDAQLWRYHRDGLATIGYDLRWYKLWKQLLWVLADLVLNPLQTAERIVQRLARRPRRK